MFKGFFAQEIPESAGTKARELTLDAGFVHNDKLACGSICTWLQFQQEFFMLFLYYSYIWAQKSIDSFLLTTT